MIKYKKPEKAIILRKACLYLMLVFLSIYGANGQTMHKICIGGKIIDAKGEPVSFATILVKTASNSQVIESIQSNEAGSFHLEVPSLHQCIIEIRMIGFEVYTKTVEIADINQIDLGTIVLGESSVMLKGVVIKDKKPFIENLAGKVVVNLDNAIISNGLSVVDLLNQLPGVQITPDDQITLNGRGITVFIDGKATPLSTEALKGMLRGMNSTNLQKIELIANPSSKFDAAGSGGIINLVKRKNHKEGLTGSIYSGYQYGRYGRPNAGAILNFKNRAYNIFVSGDYSYTKYFLDASLKSSFFSSDQQLQSESQSQIRSIRSSRSLSPTAGVDLYLTKKTTLSFSGNLGDQYFKKDGTTDFIQVYPGQNARRAVLENDVSSNMFLYSSNVYLQHKIDTIGQELTVDFNLTNNQNYSDLDNYEVRNYNMEQAGEMSRFFLKQNTDLRIYSLNADYIYPIKRVGSFETGLKTTYVISKNQNEFLNGNYGSAFSNDGTFKYKESVNALYLNFNKKYKNYSFEAGIRGEHTWGAADQMQAAKKFQKSYFKLFPSISFLYNVNEFNSLKIGFNKRINRPRYENLNPLVRFVNSNTYIQGNPFLLPGISFNPSVTYSYKNQLFLNFVYSFVKNDLIYSTSAFDSQDATVTSPFNNDFIRFYNLSLSYSKKLTSWLFTSNNVEFIQRSSKGTVNDIEFNTSGDPSLNFSTYNTISLNDRMSFMTLFRYYGRQEENNRTTRSNYVLAAGLSSKIFNKRGTVSLNVYDILGSYRSEYTENSEVVRQSWENIYDLKRLFRASFTYSLGSGKVKKVNTGKGAEEEKTRSVTEEK